MTTIHYIYNNSRIKEKLNEYFQSQGITAERYNIDTLPKVDYLLLMNPCKVGDMYYDTHLLWHAYLKSKFPNTKLIICNMNEKPNICDNNYLCIMDFPERFSDILKHALPVSELNRIEPINESIRVQLQRYFKGHHHSSLFQRFNYLEMTIKNIEYARTGEIDRTFQEAKESLFMLAKAQLSSFDHRWKYYLRFFKYSPFKPLRNQIISDLKIIIEYFEIHPLQTEKEFARREIPQRTAKIRKCLNEMEKYVNLQIE